MPVRLPPFEPDVARAATLPSSAYTDAEVFAAERERIFSRTWQPVGNASDVAEPGTFFTCEVAGEPLVVVRDAARELRAFYNVCRHRAGPVAQGKGARKSLTCRYHGWTYALDGRLLATPELDGIHGFDKSCHGLAPVRVEAWGPFVFVNLDPGAEPFGARLSDLQRDCEPFALDAMLPVARREYLIACNWKVYVDNYLEGYHLPMVHPGLHKELDYDRYRVETRRFHSRQIAPIRPASGDPKRKYDSGEAAYFWAFPNWMLNVYDDNVSINVVVPVSIGSTLTVFEWFVRDPERPGVRSAIEKTVAFSDEIQLEDVAICEAVQKGLSSRSYSHGRFAPSRENGVHHFQTLVHDFLSD
jgi:choline monooxygenase